VTYRKSVKGRCSVNLAYDPGAALHSFLSIILWGYMLAYLLRFSTTIHFSQCLSKSNSMIMAVIACLVFAFFCIMIVL